MCVKLDIRFGTASSIIHQFFRVKFFESECLINWERAREKLSSVICAWKAFTILMQLNEFTAVFFVIVVMVFIVFNMFNYYVMLLFYLNSLCKALQLLVPDSDLTKFNFFDSVVFYSLNARVIEYEKIKCIGENLFLF